MRKPVAHNYRKVKDGVRIDQGSVHGFQGEKQEGDCSGPEKDWGSAEGGEGGQSNGIDPKRQQDN